MHDHESPLPALADTDTVTTFVDRNCLNSDDDDDDDDDKKRDDVKLQLHSGFSITEREQQNKVLDRHQKKMWDIQR